MGVYSRIRRTLKALTNQADKQDETVNLKTPHVTCPKCRHLFARKPSAVERLAGMAGQISMKELLYIYRNYCVGCDQRFRNINEATIDHIMPKSKGGTNELHNYQLLCKPCNTKKGSKWRSADPHWNPTVKLKHLVEVNDLVAPDLRPGQSVANPQSNPSAGGTK